MVHELGQALERNGYFDNAAHCYEKALTVDPLVESFYQRLIRLHTRRGRHADAVRVYERCRDTLREILKVAPSAETDAALAGKPDTPS